MTNDENDKWTDNRDSPIIHTHSSNELEEEWPKRKVLKNQINDEKELSMEELMKYSKNKDVPIRNIEKNGKSREELVGNMTKNESTREHTKNDKPKDDNNKSKELVNIGGQTKQDATKEELIKENLPDENQKMKDQLKKLKEELKEHQYLKDLSKYIKNLDSNIAQLASELKTFTDAKSWEAIQRGKIEVRRYANYYDTHGTITTATASDPHDFDSAAYDVERIFESLERFSEIIYVTNDGADNLYVIVSHGGRTRFSTEAIIYPKEIKWYFNVYEIRLRSPTAGLPYRVTEYRIDKIS